MESKGVSRQGLHEVLYVPDGDHGALIIVCSQGGGGVCRTGPASAGHLAAFWRNVPDALKRLLRSSIRVIDELVLEILVSRIS